MVESERPAPVPSPPPLPTTGLLTDQYELTMVDAALRSGVAGHRAAFECFCRRLPPGRRYGVVGGTGRLVEELARFRFDDGAILSMLTNYNKDRSLAQSHAAILMAGQAVEEIA